MVENTGLVSITKTVQTVSGTGTLMNSKHLVVSGFTLSEVKKVFDEEWKKE